MVETHTDTDLYSLPEEEAEHGLRIQLAAAYRRCAKPWALVSRQVAHHTRPHLPLVDALGC